MKVKVYIDNDNVPHGRSEAYEYAENYYCEEMLNDDFLNFLASFPMSDIYLAFFVGDEDVKQTIFKAWNEHHGRTINKIIQDNFDIYEIKA